MLQPPPPAGDLLDVRQVRLLLEGTYCVTEIYRTFKVGRKKLGPNRVRWSKKAINQWLESLGENDGRSDKGVLRSC